MDPPVLARVHLGARGPYRTSSTLPRIRQVSTLQRPQPLSRRLWLIAPLACLGACAQMPSPKPTTVGASVPRPDSRPRPAADGPSADPIGEFAATDASPAQLSAEQSRQVTLHAMTLVGTPYRRGGNTPDTGFDCSGLIAYVYRQEAQLLAPRTVATLQFWGRAVEPWQTRAGDLVIFSTQGQAEPTHAGIYVGAGRFVHAPSTGGTVRLDSIQGPYWARQLAVYRRP